MNNKLVYVFIAMLLVITGLAVAEETDYGKLFQKMQKQVDKIDDYQCTFESFSANDVKTKSITYKYYFKKPKSVRMEIQTGEQKGVVLVYTLTQNKVKVRLNNPALAMIPVILDPTNKDVCDLRGYGLHQSDWGWYIDQHLKNMKLFNGKITGEEVVNGRKTIVCELVSRNPGETSSIAKEKVWIDKELTVPLKYLQYDSTGKLILSSMFSNIQLNRQLKNKLFTEFDK
jgi:outer membrane lipoprotein-sorting protein